MLIQKISGFSVPQSIDIALLTECRNFSRVRYKHSTPNGVESSADYFDRSKPPETKNKIPTGYAEDVDVAKSSVPMFMAFINGEA